VPIVAALYVGNSWNENPAIPIAADQKADRDAPTRRGFGDVNNICPPVTDTAGINPFDEHQWVFPQR
jgi:hypothetical protein